jgi:hypothetical protein
MSAEHEARRIAVDVLDDFRRVFPGSKILPAEQHYLAAIIVQHVREALSWYEDDHR